MTGQVSNALFYPLSFTYADLVDLLSGAKDPAVLDTVDFTEETGGESVRQLAVPRLPGMDEVEVQQARFQVRALPRDMDISAYSVQTGPGGQGVYLSLDKPGRLKKVEVEYTLPAPVPGAPPMHVVVSSAQKSDAGMKAGTPLFAADDFEPPGPMFPRTLSGMSQVGLGGNRFLLRLPSVLGDAWLIQIASGDSAVKLAPRNIPITIRRVTLDAAPSNLAVTLSTANGEVPLWSNPQLLLPSSGVQDISFTPVAQKELAAALKAAGADAVTLPLTIRFRSATGGALGIETRTLQVRYVVRPVAGTPAVIALKGARAALTLSAPASLMPQASALRLVARCKGWELNGGTPEPPLDDPSTGLRVTQANTAAQSVRFEGSRFSLVNVRLYLAAPVAAEAVMELREDAGGAPAAMIGKPIVRQLDAGFRDWVDFQGRPTSFPGESTPLWVVLRVTKGEVYWFAGDGGGGARISLDKGATWGESDPRLTSVTSLLAQLFHDRSSEPMASAPVIRLESGSSTIAADLMRNAVAVSPREFVLDGFALPAAVLSFYQRQPGSARVDQKLQLFSRSVLDFRIENAAIFYDPFTSGMAGA